jgi:hypothetical protein
VDKLTPNIPRQRLLFIIPMQNILPFSIYSQLFYRANAFAI